MYVRWEDVDVLATGRWKDRAAHAALEYRGARGFGAAIERRWTEPEPESRPAGAADAVAPWLRWRATSLRLTARGLGAAWSAGVEYGEGEQGLRAWRSGGRYLVITGPVSSTLLSLEVDPWRAPLRLRAFGGGWRGSAQGSLALWPFDALGAVSGSYRVAHSTASLDHWGLALERPDRPASRLDGGLALWSLSPRASYQSWQGTWLALVRSDQTAGATTLTSVLALGGRLGTRFTAAGVRCRLEAVQWVPVRSVREPEPGAASGGGGSGTVAGPGVHPRESGGTILRLSLEPGR